MMPLTNQQKQLIFDYCIGVTSEKDSSQIQELISSSEEAAQIHSKLKTALTPLNSLEDESCPDHLAEGTIFRLNNAARSSRLKLEQLLATEQTRTISTRNRFWRNFGEMLTAAAVIIFVAGVVIAPLNMARYESWKQQCQMQLSRIAGGLSNYQSDHDGQLPAVATATGEPWWKVGYNGPENYSNTRHMWLLVKNGYVDTTDFVCPGRRQGRALLLDSAKIRDYNDFPARKYITYSFRIKCPSSKSYDSTARRVLIADLNPLFEKLPRDYSEKLRIELTKALLSANSPNHKGRGQNVLFGDGSSNFAKTRRIGISEDDMFTLRDTSVYKGVEVPSCETDSFLAP